MNLGIIIPVCVQHEMQVESIRCARQLSEPDTDIVVLFNGYRFDLPAGVREYYQPERFTDEQDLWNWCLEYACSKQWDWCMVLHDDFAMKQAGWEQQLRQSAGSRVVLASWLAYRLWTKEANTACPVDRRMPERGQPCMMEEPRYHPPDCKCEAGWWPIGVTFDPFAFGFNTEFFNRRGTVIAERMGYGYGAWDAAAYALERDYAVWGIVLDTWHHWLDYNSRNVLRVPAPGHPEFGKKWAGTILPAQVVNHGTTIECAGRSFRVTP